MSVGEITHPSRRFLSNGVVQTAFSPAVPSVNFPFSHCWIFSLPLSNILQRLNVYRSQAGDLVGANELGQAGAVGRVETAAKEASSPHI